MKINLCQLKQNIEDVKVRMEKAAQRAGRKADDILLVAATKYVSSDVIYSLSELGITHIGENKVQDAKIKRQQLESRSSPLSLSWHMIGHLQTNKVKDALAIFDFFHSLDSLHLAQQMNKRALSWCKKIPVLLEVNVSGEISKGGFTPEDVKKERELLLSLSNLDIQGLMTMAPLEADMNTCRKIFQRLRELAQYWKEKTANSQNFRHLSMGMSRDFEVAIEEGATMVRIGSELFRGIEMMGT